MRWLVAIAVALAGAPAAAGPLTAEPEVGVVELAADGMGSTAIVLRNASTSSVTATAITAQPGCDAGAVHAAPLTGFALAPGATRTITVSCTPAPAGMQRCAYQVRSASELLGGFEAVCAYGALAALVPSDDAARFGAVAVGTPAAIPITLRNTGAAFRRVSIETTELAGTFAVAAPCNPDAHACDAQVASVPTGGTLELVATCTPRTTGPHSAALHVTTDAGTRLAAPITLTCTGLANDAPVLAATPSVIAVGAVELVGATAGATIQLANLGGAPLTVRDLAIVDAGTGAAADWRYAASLPCRDTVPPACELPAHTTSELALSFDPSALGVRDATLLVNYHDTADRSLSIPLRGEARGPTLELAGGTAALDFGALPLGRTATLRVQVVNRGTRALTDATVALAPGGGALAATPAALTVPTTGPATVTVSCTPSVAGLVTGTLQITAPDVITPPLTLAVRCTGDPAATLFATPPALQLGEVRLGATARVDFTLASLGAPVAVDARLADPDPRLRIEGAPATTPAALAVVAAPDREDPLTNAVVVTPGGLEVPVTGAAVSAAFDVADAVSLGTFCVRQPTTPRIVALSSTGTATLGLPAAPVLERADPAFDLQRIAPVGYPATLAATGRALVAITPRRQATAGLVTDALVWTTDVAARPTAATVVSATFIDDGGAIAPSSLAFPPTAIHLDNGRPQQVTLQNCSPSPLQLDAPRIEAPFSIDSPSFPTELAPGETATFSVGFHPTKLGTATKQLTITSPQLPDHPLEVALFGVGVAGTGSGGSGSPDGALDRTSFYACGSCASAGPSSLVAALVAALAIVRPRRRRPR